MERHEVYVGRDMADAIDAEADRLQISRSELYREAMRRLAAAPESDLDPEAFEDNNA